MRCIQLIAWVKTILVDRGNEKTITTTSTVVNKKTTQSNHKRKIHRESIYNAFDLINWSVNISLRCQFSFYFRMIVSQTIFNRLIGGTLFTILLFSPEEGFFFFSRFVYVSASPKCQMKRSKYREKFLRWMNLLRSKSPKRISSKFPYIFKMK